MQLYCMSIKNVYFFCYSLFSVYGTYRKIIEKVEDLKWSVIRYSDENSDLLISDMDEMKGVKPVESITGEILLIQYNSTFDSSLKHLTHFDTVVCFIL